MSLDYKDKCGGCAFFIETKPLLINNKLEKYGYCGHYTKRKKYRLGNDTKCEKFVDISQKDTVKQRINDWLNGKRQWL